MPPGLTGEIAQFIYQSSYKPVPEMSIVAALGFMAGLTGRAYNISNTGLNLYILLLAGTGRGKEAMARGIGTLCGHIERTFPMINEFRGPGDAASGQALLRYLSEHNTASVCSVFGEFGVKLQSICSDRAGSHELMLQKVLLDLYSKSGANDSVQPTTYSDSERNTKIIQSPAFSMIGESVPQWFYENVNQGMISSGLLPRFHVVEYLGKRPPSQPGAEYVQPDPQMINQIMTVASTVQGLLAQNQRCPVRMDEAATRLNLELDQRCDDIINNSNEGLATELWNRAHLKTLRVAAILAVGKNPYQPVIDSECFLWAENFTNHGIETLKKRFDTGSYGVSNTENDRIATVLKELAKYVQERPIDDRITDAVYNHYAFPYSWMLNKLRRRSVFNQERGGATNAIKQTLHCLQEMEMIQLIPPHQAKRTFNSEAKHYAIVGDIEDFDDYRDK